MEDPRSRAPVLPQNGFIDRRDSFIFIITLMAQLSMLELLNIPRSSATDKKIWDDLFEVEDEEWVMVDEEDPERGEAYEVFIDRLVSLQSGVVYATKFREDSVDMDMKLLEMIHLFPNNVIHRLATTINPTRYEVTDEDTFSERLSVSSNENDTYEPDYDEQRISQYLLNYPACAEKGYLEMGDINTVAVVAQWSYLASRTELDRRYYKGHEIATKMMFWAVGTKGFFEAHRKFTRETGEKVGSGVLRSRLEVLKR